MTSKYETREDVGKSNEQNFFFKIEHRKPRKLLSTIQWIIMTELLRSTIHILYISMDFMLDSVNIMLFVIFFSCDS